MSEENNFYTIPQNYTNSGKFLGMFDLRCMIEAAALAVAIIYPILQTGLRLELKIFVCLAIALVLTFFVGSGIRGDSLTQYIHIVYKHFKTKRKLSYSFANKQKGSEMSGQNSKAGKNKKGNQTR